MAEFSSWNRSPAASRTSPVTLTLLVPRRTRTWTIAMETGPYHILATSSRTDDRTRVLKHADTFAVFDYHGDIEPGGLGEQGLYHEGTRFLSCLSLDLEGGRPFVLNSTVRHENDQLVVVLSNPDLLSDGRIVAPFGTLCLTVRKFLWRGVCYQQIHVRNHALEPVEDVPFDTLPVGLRRHFRGSRHEAKSSRPRPAS